MHTSFQQHKSKLLWQFALFGIAFGTCFPIIAIGVDLWVKELPLLLGSMYAIHASHPIRYIILPR